MKHPRAHGDDTYCPSSDPSSGGQWNREVEGTVLDSDGSLFLCTLFFIKPPIPPYISSEAVAPVMISTSSPVMTACRVLLYRMVNLLIMSPAFFEAFYDTVSDSS